MYTFSHKKKKQTFYQIDFLKFLKMYTIDQYFGSKLRKLDNKTLDYFFHQLA